MLAVPPARCPPALTLVPSPWKGTTSNPHLRHGQALLRFGVHTRLERDTQQGHVPLSCPPIPLILTQLPRMSHEQEPPALPWDIHRPAADAPSKSTGGLGRGAEGVCHKPPHTHPSLPGHTRHSLENPEEGKTQPSPLLPNTSGYVQAVS